MTTTLILTAAALWLVVIPAAIYLLLRHDRSQDEAWEAERPERPPLPQRRPSDLSSGVGWAAESTPIHDRLVCEQIEREEGWVS